MTRPLQRLDQIERDFGAFDPLVYASPHLKWHELRCHDGTPYPDKWRTTRGRDLAYLFESIRALYHMPIGVLSAYRTPTHNRRVGGAKLSQHVEGRALDLTPPRGVTIARFTRDVRQLADALWRDPDKPDLIGGIGAYLTRGFLHVDTRPGRRLVVWKGTAAKDAPHGWLVVS